KDGLRFSADSAAISGNVGDELSFEVVEGRMENGRPTLTLKQLHGLQGAQLQNAKRAQSNKELFRANGYIPDADSPAGEQDEQLERLRAISAIRRRILQGRSVGSQITGTLAAMGLNIDKISFGMFSSIINDLGIHNARKVADALANEAVKTYTDRPDSQFSTKADVLDALARHGVPLTDDNIQTAITAIDMFDASGGITPQAKAYLLKEDRPLNITNIYSGRYLATSGAASTLSPAELEGLTKAISEFFAHMNIDNTPENKALAQFMIRNSIDITPENIQRLSFLNHMSDATTRAQVLDLISTAMSIGKDPMSVRLDAPLPSPDATQLMGYYTDLIATYPDISHISDNNLGTALAIANGRNPHTSMAAIRHVAAGFAHGAYNLLEDLPANDASKRYLSLTRIHLEEIRLKLSFEAAQVLAAKGIDIDTLPLADALEKVRQARREALEGSFKAFAHAPDEAALSLLERTNDALRHIRPLGPTTLGMLLQTRGHTEPSINSILTSLSHERATAGYEEFMTTVSHKHGDSFTKVKDQFARFLESIDVKPTAPNIFAAEILSRNNIPVTTENIAQMKLIDREVSFVAERLHPVIAASIIRDGLNPLDMHIRVVISYINSFNDAFGISDSDQIASYIAQMDSENKLSATEREKMIAFYRVLNQVTRHGSAALGTLYKNGAEPTLGNMLNAADYFRHSRGGNESIFSQNTDSGLLEEVVNGNATIRGILANTAPTPDLTGYIARELVPNLPPNELGTVLYKAETNPNVTLEEALDEMALKAGQAQDNSIPQSNMAKSHADIQAELRFTQIFETPPKAIHWLESRGITATPTTMAAISSLMSDQFYIGKELDKTRKRLNDAVNQPEQPNSGHNKAAANSANHSESKAASPLESALDALNIDNIASYSPADLAKTLAPHTDLKALRSAIQIKSAATNLQGGADYTYPIKLHDRIANLNMYVLNSRNLATAPEGRALLALNTGSLGNVFGYAEADGSSLSLRISGNNPEAVAFLESQADALYATLAQAGFDTQQISISFSHQPEEPYPALEDDMNPRITLPDYTGGWRA
ncbi:MAG: flagellar hook-length control protein FliK, partial [Defluviitaleaceae bacterium]|nr:flagellar hook-length control protein FliK [Defluviitaleaceae bacterium]